MPRKAVLPADLPALKRLVAGEKIVAKCMPFVEDPRETMIGFAEPAAYAQQHQGRGDPTAFKSGVADTSWHSGAELDQPFLLHQRKIEDGLHDRWSAVTHSEKIGETLPPVGPIWTRYRFLKGIL